MRFYRQITVLLLVPSASFAQEIGVKSIPVATGSQFLLFPSENAAIGGVSIALNDRLGDPFENPARAVSVRGSYFTSTPYYYSIGATSNPGGHAARTLPLGLLLQKDRYFGGATLAWQEMIRRDVRSCCFIAEDGFGGASITVVPEEGTLTRSNLYLSVLGGMRISPELSVGFSVFRGRLKGLEGVQLLYSSGDDVDQDGRMATYKGGLYQKWQDGRTAELVVQTHRFSMSHAMTTVFWDDQEWHTEPRLEKDETNGVSLRMGYTQPLTHGWTAGVRLVGDWKTHPKIPNYDLMQIPRDPGNTGAYNIGVGFSREIEKTTYGFDLIYEPIWSHTWANAEEDIVAEEGRAGVRAGEMTVENFFRFHNAIFRMGVRRESRLQFGLGLNLHLIRYRLEQEDFVWQTNRVLNEAWGEWTLTAGLGYDFSGFSLQYLGILTTGTGQPGLARSGAWLREDLSFADASFVVAPAGALDLLDARVWTHRLSLLIPLHE